jgi:hypothetical protein
MLITGNVMWEDVPHEKICSTLLSMLPILVFHNTSKCEKDTRRDNQPAYVSDNCNYTNHLLAHNSHVRTRRTNESY